MDKAFNRQVFASFPDTLWTGEMPRKARKSAPKLILRYFFQVAAAACILFTAFTLLFQRQNKKDAPALAQVSRSAVVYTVNDAVRASLYLPDSTLVTLNCGSTLTLADDFGQGSRTVSLDGEAYFDVRRNRELPFLVRTPQGIEVKVTGTKFNMSCYADEPVFDLTLLEGSVEVTTRKKEVLEVKPSEQILIKNDFLNISRIQEPEESLEWTEGILRFDHTPMREAVSRMEKWYGVDIVVEDESVYQNSISGAFHSEPLQDVLRLICISCRLDYSVSDKTVTLRSRNQSATK